ncbi:MAG: hypothetical protein ACYDEA_03510 [Candidatus Dormibacteria bacterium]
MNGYLTHSEVEGLAKPLGVTWRSVQLWTSWGLIAGPVQTGKGAGHGKGSEYRWPPMVAAQLEALAEARKHTRSWPGLRHWLWWEGFPVEWESWRAYALELLLTSAQEDDKLRKMGEDQRAREAVKLARSWGRQRYFPVRRRRLRTAEVRKQVATWVLNGQYQGLEPDLGAQAMGDDLASVLGLEDLSAAPTVDTGELLERVFGPNSESRAATAALLGVQPGELDAAIGEAVGTQPGALGPALSQLVTSQPGPSENVRRLEVMTEAEAIAARDVVKSLEALLCAQTGLGDLRAEPGWAVVMMITIPHTIPDAIARAEAALQG